MKIVDERSFKKKKVEHYIGAIVQNKGDIEKFQVIKIAEIVNERSFKKKKVEHYIGAIVQNKGDIEKFQVIKIADEHNNLPYGFLNLQTGEVINNRYVSLEKLSKENQDDIFLNAELVIKD